LVALEYLLVHRGGRGQSFEYELLYDGKGMDGKPFMMGLLDIQSLESMATTKSLGGESLKFGGSLLPHTGPIVPPLLDDETPLSANKDQPSHDSSLKPSPNTHLEPNDKIISYRYPTRPNGKFPSLATSSGSAH
jgi:hypothetical protein